MEAYVRYPTDLGLAADGTTTLARESAGGRGLASANASQARNRSAAVQRWLRRLNRTVAPRTVQGKATALRLTGQAGRLVAPSAPRRRALAPPRPRPRCPGQSSRQPTGSSRRRTGPPRSSARSDSGRPARTSPTGSSRCPIPTHGRSARASCASPMSLGDVFQFARSVRRPAAARAARSFPPSPRRGRATTCSLPAPPKSTVSTSRRARSRRMAGPSAGGAEDLPDVDRRLHRSSPVGRRQVPIAGWPSSAWAARAASALERRFGLKRPGSKVTTTPAAGPPGRSSPTTSTPSPSDRPRSIPSASGSSPGANLQPGPRHPAAVLVLQRSRFIRGQVTSG